VISSSSPSPRLPRRDRSDATQPRLRYCAAPSASSRSTIVATPTAMVSSSSGVSRVNGTSYSTRSPVNRTRSRCVDRHQRLLDVRREQFGDVRPGSLDGEPPVEGVVPGGEAVAVSDLTVRNPDGKRGLDSLDGGRYHGVRPREQPRDLCRDLHRVAADDPLQIRLPRPLRRWNDESATSPRQWRRSRSPSATSPRNQSTIGITNPRGEGISPPPAITCRATTTTSVAVQSPWRVCVPV